MRLKFYFREINRRRYGHAITVAIQFRSLFASGPFAAGQPLKLAGLTEVYPSDAYHLETYPLFDRKRLSLVPTCSPLVDARTAGEEVTEGGRVAANACAHKS